MEFNYDNPPDCTNASPSNALIQPDKQHKFKPVGIKQDEPVNSVNDGNTSPDGKGVGTGIAQVRAERSGIGDGRVYHISFEADDGKGIKCTGEVLVKVPLSSSSKAPVVDQGALYDSTLT